MKAIIGFAPTSGCSSSENPEARISEARSSLDITWTFGARPSQCKSLSSGLYGTEDSARHGVELTKKPPGLSNLNARASTLGRCSTKWSRLQTQIPSELWGA